MLNAVLKEQMFIITHKDMVNSHLLSFKKNSPHIFSTESVVTKSTEQQYI